jgi:hypothetical protein
MLVDVLAENLRMPNERALQIGRVLGDPVVDRLGVLLESRGDGLAERAMEHGAGGRGHLLPSPGRRGDRFG